MKTSTYQMRSYVTLAVQKLKRNQNGCFIVQSKLSKGELEIKESIERFMDVEQKKSLAAKLRS